MRKYLNKIKATLRTNNRRLDPEKPEERRELISKAVERAFKEYGEVLKKLGNE